MKNKIHFLRLQIFLLAAQVSLFLPRPAAAACDAKFMSQFQGAFDWMNANPNLCDASSLIVYVLKMLFGFAGIVAVVSIVLGGFWYLASAGNEELAEKGKKTLINSVIGLVVIILAETVVTIIGNTLTK